nr:MAG TPA: hypothetical protein [Caudoviricetes sp.]
MPTIGCSNSRHPKPQLIHLNWGLALVLIGLNGD